jgi:membrane-bound inhibitor of C-type lysozyme
MRREILVIVATALSLSACGRQESDSATADGAASAAPAAASTGFDYTCSDGKTFNARVDRGNVVLTIDGQTLTLPPDANASGAHYSGEDTTFIATGKEATLIKAGETARTCQTK